MPYTANDMCLDVSVTDRFWFPFLFIKKKIIKLLYPLRHHRCRSPSSPTLRFSFTPVMLLAVKIPHTNTNTFPLSVHDDERCWSSCRFFRPFTRDGEWLRRARCILDLLVILVFWLKSLSLFLPMMMMMKTMMNTLTSHNYKVSHIHIYNRQSWWKIILSSLFLSSAIDSLYFLSHFHPLL